MSVKATSFVRRLRGLDATEKAVAFVYADHANHETGDTYPSMDTVADESGLADRSTASKATGRLAEFKIIVTDKPSKGGKPTVWCFNYSLQDCPATITLAPLNRVPKSRLTVTKNHSPKEPNRDPKEPNCDPKQPNCVPESHKGVESKSKGEPKSKAEAEAEAATAAAIDEAFKLLNTGYPYGSPEFQIQWLAAVDDSPNRVGDVRTKEYPMMYVWLPDTMEACIVSCQRKGIKVPKPFYRDKRLAEMSSELHCQKPRK